MAFTPGEASALDLYEALKALEHAVMRWGLHVTEELDGELEEQESEDRGESSVALFAAIAKARAAINKAEGRP